MGKGLSYVRGTIAMARTSALNSATSQFFLNLSDNVALDTASGGYAVFGKLVDVTQKRQCVLAGISRTTVFVKRKPVVLVE